MDCTRLRELRTLKAVSLNDQIDGLKHLNVCPDCRKWLELQDPNAKTVNPDDFGPLAKELVAALQGMATTINKSATDDRELSTAINTALAKLTDEQHAHLKRKTMKEGGRMSRLDTLTITPDGSLCIEFTCKCDTEPACFEYAVTLEPRTIIVLTNFLAANAGNIIFRM